MPSSVFRVLVVSFIAVVIASSGPSAIAQTEPLLGTVTNKADDPLEGVAVVLRSPGVTEIIEEHVTDKDGVFSIPMESLRPGYEIHLHTDGYQDVVVSITAQHLVVPKIGVVLLRTPGIPTARPAPSEDKPKAAESYWEPSALERRERAIRLYNDAVEKFEEDAEDRDAARLAAEQLFREAASIDPTFPDPLRILGRIAIKRQNWAEASRYSEALIRIDPNDDEAVGNLYVSLVIMRHFKRVGEAAKMLITIDPEKITFVESHAEEFYRNKIFVMARALYQALTEIAPDAPNAYLNLGTCCAALGDVEATRAAYETFLELAPEDHPDIATIKQELAKLDATEEPE